MFSVFSKPNFKNPTGSISASVGRIDSKWKSVTHQAGIYAGEDGYDKIYNSIGLVPNLGVESKGKASSTTQSAISDGILTVDGKEIDTKTINTNTENTLHQLDKIFDKKKIEERQELARLFAKNAYEQLHNWQPTTKEGKIAKAFAHGVIGEWAARMAGNAPSSGFKAIMTNELLIEKIKQIADNDPALAQWLGAAVGGVVNKVSGDPVNAGAATTSYATKWNEGLFHIDRVDLDGISEDNKDLALADLNYDLAQSNRYNINKLREKKNIYVKIICILSPKGLEQVLLILLKLDFQEVMG